MKGPTCSQVSRKIPTVTTATYRSSLLMSAAGPQTVHVARSYTSRLNTLEVPLILTTVAT